MLATTGLFGAGYLAVDFFLAQSKITVTQDQTRHQSAPETTSVHRARHAGRGVGPGRRCSSPDERIVTYDGAKPSDTPGTLPEGLSTTGLGTGRRWRRSGRPVRGGLALRRRPRPRQGRGAGVRLVPARGHARLRARPSSASPTCSSAAPAPTADVERAKVWYRRAAEQGHVKRHAQSGRADRPQGRRRHPTMRRQPHGSGRRPSAGWPTASTISGCCARWAWACRKSLPEAYKWLALAARGGDKEAAGTAAAGQDAAGRRPRSPPPSGRLPTGARAPLRSIAPGTDDVASRWLNRDEPRAEQSPSAVDTDAVLAHPSFLLCFAFRDACN